jgi:hypothetical protein
MAPEQSVEDDVYTAPCLPEFIPRVTPVPPTGVHVAQIDVVEHGAMRRTLSLETGWRRPQTPAKQPLGFRLRRTDI